MGALFSCMDPESAAASRDEAAFAEAESRLPPVSGVRILRLFAWKEASRLGDMSRMTYRNNWALQRLAYARGPLEWVDFLELSGERRMELRLRAGEEALLARVDVPIRTMGTMEPQPRPCILVARRAIPSSGPRVQAQVADGSLVECEPEAIAEAELAATRRSGLRHIPREAVTAWRCDNRWSWEGNLPQFDRPLFGPDPNLRPPPMTGGIPAEQAIAQMHARREARARGEPEPDDWHRWWADQQESAR